MEHDEDRLQGLYTSRLEELRELASANELSRTGNVEQLRARLIAHLVLGDLDLSSDSIGEMSNKNLSKVLAIFGVKRSGSVKEKRQRLYLHLNHDPKKLNPESVADLTREGLHELCKSFGQRLSGNKQQLFARVVGVLASQEGSWGKVKKSLRRPRGQTTSATSASTTTAAATSPSSAAPAMDDSEAAELAAMMQEGIDSVDVDALTDVLIDDDAPQDEAIDGPDAGPESESETATGEGGSPTDDDDGGDSDVGDDDYDESAEGTAVEVTIDEGAGAALIELEARAAELHSHIREFLIVGKAQDASDISAFVDDLGDRGFHVDHSVVRDKILDEIKRMIALRDAENDASGVAPGSWRERKALRRLEEVRPALLDSLENILDDADGDIALARVRFESAAADAKLDLELPAISGRVHGLFDLQVSLRASEADEDPVTSRRRRAMDVLYRGTQDTTPEAMRTLQRFEEQIESFERVVETIVRRAEGQFGPVEHALLVRFLERRGWDASHPEVRARAIAAAGVLAAAMGYIHPDDVPGLPTALSLDPDKVADVVDSLRGLLVDLGKSAPTDASVAFGVPAEAAAVAEEVSTVNRVRDKLDSADALLLRLSRGFSSDDGE